MNTCIEWILEERRADNRRQRRSLRPRGPALARALAIGWGRDRRTKISNSTLQEFGGISRQRVAQFAARAKARHSLDARLRGPRGVRELEHSNHSIPSAPGEGGPRKRSIQLVQLPPWGRGVSRIL